MKLAAFPTDKIECKLAYPVTSNLFPTLRLLLNTVSPDTSKSLNSVALSSTYNIFFNVVFPDKVASFETDNVLPNTVASVIVTFFRLERPTTDRVPEKVPASLTSKRVVETEVAPVTLPSKSANTVDFVIFIEPVLPPEASVVPKLNLSLVSFHPIKALSFEPRLIIIPLS